MRLEVVDKIYDSHILKQSKVFFIFFYIYNNNYLYLPNKKPVQPKNNITNIYKNRPLVICIGFENNTNAIKHTITV